MVWLLNSFCSSLSALTISPYNSASMQLHHDIPLKDYSTMRLGGKARHLVTIHSKAELLEALAWADQQQLPILVLGEGSNVIVRDEGFSGLIIINRITGFKVLDDGVTLCVGAGEHWDSVVARAVALGLSGIELLSFIPGTAGATPVQNVGAYGAEIADTFIDLEAYDQATRRFVTLTKDDCHFSYRNSIFKPFSGRRYIITSITLRLHKSTPKPPFYRSLQEYLAAHHITSFTPQTIRDAVIAIRTVRLPDPKLIANTGSFFKNPIVPRTTLQHLQLDYPGMPFYETADGRVKLLAGWLLDQAGLKGYHNHGMKIYESNALVFVNENAQTYHDLATFKTEVVKKIEEKFGITLEQEPETIGS